VREVNPEIRVSLHSVDYSSQSDVTDSLYPPEIQQNLSVVVNNVGLLTKGPSLQEDPQSLQNEIKVNLYPISLLSAFALRSFKSQSKSGDAEGKRYALIQLSSLSGIRAIPPMGSYGATKRYDSVLGQLINKLNQKEKMKSTPCEIDSTILYPSLTTTAMVNFVSAKINCCSTYQSVSGTLRDLGFLSQSNGSHNHNFWGL